MRTKLSGRWPLVLAGLLLLCCGFCVWRMWAVSHLLDSQRAAQRWKGESERDFSQISCCMPPVLQLTRDDIYKFRKDMMEKLKAASFDVETEKGLYLDAWCAFCTAKVSAGRQSGEVQVVAVGGDFFSFHPLRLISGNYIQPGDVMDDRVLLDKETAWLLFGAVDVAGMSFSLGGMPVVVAGVYAHEDDAFSRAAYGESMRVYMSYSALQRLNTVTFDYDSISRSSTGDFLTDAVIDAINIGGMSALSGVAKGVEEYLNSATYYELLMVEPVKGFAYSAVTEKFPTKTVQFIENTYRFEPSRLFKLLRSGMERSMRRGTYYFPYWENAARAAEDRAASWFMAALLTGSFPVALLFYSFIRYAVVGRRKLERDVLPEAKARGRELARSWKRRRWERRHPDELE